MRDFRAVYRGYAIYISGTDSSWSSRAESIRFDVPILASPVSDGHASWGRALRRAKREIERVLSEFP
jgi:hypothetical protein